MQKKLPPEEDLTRSRAVTKEDVARAAGVSHITVSRVINSPDKVAPATREKVQTHIARMGYIPNLLAGGLASRRTRIIAAVVPTIGHSIFADTVRGMSEHLMAHGYQLLLGQSDYSEEIETRLVEAFIGRRVDGLVLTGVQHSAATRQRLKAAGIPVVETWDLTPDPIDMLAGFSNYDAGAAMGDYLVEQGYRRIAFVGGEDPRGVARMAGLSAALKRRRLKVPIRITASPGSFLQGGREAMKTLLEKYPDVDAAFFSNDVIAAGAVMECDRRKVRIPQDIAIAGFANLDIAAEINPPLTTVHVSSHRIGETAAQMLLVRLDGGAGEQPGVVSDLGFSIIRRGSA